MSTEDEKYKFVKRMFSDISGTYDLLNHLLSLGFDIIWRFRFAAAAVRSLDSSGSYLMDGNKKKFVIIDYASGTGDVVSQMLFVLKYLFAQKWRDARFVFCCADLSHEMLSLARKKLNKKYPDLARDFHYVVCDASARCFRAGSFDAATVAFGIRNFPSVRGFARSAFDALKNGGTLSVLEFCNFSDAGLMSFFKKYYMKVVSPLGRSVSGHVRAYSYLVESIFRFSSEEEVVADFASCGFTAGEPEKLFPSLVTSYFFKKYLPS